MVISKAKTVEQYLASLPTERRAVVAAVRETILANLDAGFTEGMGYGMIGYHVPHSLYPAGYHCDPEQPLPYAGLAAQKNHFAVYLFGIYCDPDEARQFERDWKAAGKKLDMGKCCVRFKRLDDVPLDVLAAAIRRWPLQRFVGVYEATLGARRQPAASRPAKVAKQAVAKAAKARSAKAKSTKAGKVTKVAKAPAKKSARKARAAVRRAR